MVIDVLLGVLIKLLLNLSRQAHDRSLMARKQTVRLDIANEAVRCALSPALGILYARYAVVAAVDFEMGNCEA